MSTRNSKEIVKRGERGRLLPGSILNPGGRGKGRQDFKTKWFKAIEKIADTKGITADEVEQELLLVGYDKAKDGDYQFYRDIFDRVYGKPMQRNELTGKDGEAIEIKSMSDDDFNVLLNNYATNRPTEDIGIEENV